MYDYGTVIEQYLNTELFHCFSLCETVCRVCIIVPDSGDVPLLPILVNYETSLGDLLSPLFANTVLQLQQY